MTRYQFTIACTILLCLLAILGASIPLVVSAETPIQTLI